MRDKPPQGCYPIDNNIKNNDKLSEGVELPVLQNRNISQPYHTNAEVKQAPQLFTMLNDITSVVCSNRRALA